MSWFINPRQIAGLLLLLVGVLGLFISQFLQGNGLTTSPLRQSQSCRVLTFYDGDTLGCDMNGNGRIDGNIEHVRLLGIDAPEMHYSHKNRSGRDQPFAREALQFLKTKTQGNLVRLQMDQQWTDRYGRRLAFIYVDTDTRSINEQLVSKGFARLLFIPPNRLYHAQLQQALRQAKQAQVGQWQALRS